MSNTLLATLTQKNNLRRDCFLCDRSGVSEVDNHALHCSYLWINDHKVVLSKIPNLIRPNQVLYWIFVNSRREILKTKILNG